MKELELFAYDTNPETMDSPCNQNAAADVVNHSARIRRSALWAAYGDALGWISELTDEAGLMRRTQGEPLSEPLIWKRRIGGRSGITVSLPKGCYSDDSQLRLATCRAIRSDGFDVEAFAKIELPVWLSYALGGGRATTAAAEHLAKPRSSWFANTFKGWTSSGGNGAAMRIQPHVWATRTPNDPYSFLPDVVRNSICTHSHPTGLMGAVLHSLCVAHAVASGVCPSPGDLDKAIEVAERLPEIMASDMELEYWRSAFERESGPFSDAWAHEVQRTRDAIRAVDSTHTTASERYKGMVDELKLRDPSHRGSGALTAVAAVALTWYEMCPVEAMRIAANELGTDTDTIATMAGAILGAVADSDPPVDVLDASLFRFEAKRLAEIAVGGAPSNHAYPDLLHWSSPTTRADALTYSDDRRLQVSGLGSISKILGEPIAGPKGDFRWQWVQLAFGQTMLIKHRPNIEIANEVVDQSISEASDIDNRPTTPNVEDSNLHQVLAYVEKHIDVDERVGRTLRRVVRRGTPGQIYEFVGKLIDLLRQASS